MVMSSVMDALAENPSATGIVLNQKRDYEYYFDQTMMLLEIAKLQKQLSRQRIFMLDNARPSLYVQLKNIFYHKMKSDPAAAFYELRALHDAEKGRKDEVSGRVAAFLGKLVKLFEDTKFISTAKRFPYKYG